MVLRHFTNHHQAPSLSLSDYTNILGGNHCIGISTYPVWNSRFKFFYFLHVLSVWSLQGNFFENLKLGFSDRRIRGSIMFCFLTFLWQGSDLDMNWVQRKIYLYNVTFGLYMLDWWERYLFSILSLASIWSNLNFVLFKNRALAFSFNILFQILWL